MSTNITPTDIFTDIQIGMQLAPGIIAIIAAIEKLFPQPGIGPTVKLPLAQAVVSGATGLPVEATDPVVAGIATPVVAAMKAQASGK